METEWGVWMNSSEIYLGQLLPSVEKYILICGTCFSALTDALYLSKTFFSFKFPKARQESPASNERVCLSGIWILTFFPKWDVASCLLASASHLVSPYAPSQGSGQSWQLKPGEGRFRTFRWPFPVPDNLSEFTHFAQSLIWMVPSISLKGRSNVENGKIDSFERMSR